MKTDRITDYHKWHGKYEYGSVSDNVKALGYQMKLSGGRLETKGLIFYMQLIFTMKFTAWYYQYSKKKKDKRKSSLKKK